MDNLKSEIKQEIPKPSRILGFYDDEEERWIKSPFSSSTPFVLTETKDIVKFLRLILKDAERIRNIFKIENFRFSIDVEIEGEGLREVFSFEVSIKKDFKDAEFITMFLKKIKAVKWVHQAVKIRIIKIMLVF